MEGTVTWATLWGVIVAMAGIVVACFAVWWRIEGKVEKAKTDALTEAEAANKRADAAAGLGRMAREELSEYKTHVAETYISKEGHREANQQLMSAIGDLRGDVRGIRDRFDSFMDQEKKPSGRR